MWDQYEKAMDWYKKHMGWKFLEEELNHKMKRAAFVMPSGGHANFHTFRDEDEHFSSYGLYEGNSRLCFQMADLDRNLDYFHNHGIRYTEPRRLPDGRDTFDIYAYGDTRLTVIVDSELDGRFPDARILSFSPTPVRFGVRDVERSIQLGGCSFLYTNQGGNAE